MSEQAATVGDRIRATRKREGISQTDLAQKMGKTLDFTLEYKDYFPVDDGSDDNNTTDGGNGWVVAVIIVASVAVLAAAAVAVFFILKKKNLFCKKSDGEASKKED